MPDTTGMSVGAIGLTQGMDQTAYQTRTAAMRTVAETGQSFDAVIDATAVSILAGSQLRTEINTDVIGDTREWNAVEASTPSTATRPNDYSQPTGASRTGNRTGDAMEGRGDEMSFDSGLETSLSEAGERLVDETAETFGVSEEEVLQAMQTLGFTMIDLLNPENMTQLVTQVTGEEDVTALLTDGGLYDNLQNLLDEAGFLRDNIAETYEMTPEQMTQAIAQFGSQGEEALPEAPVAETTFAGALTEAAETTVTETPEEEIAGRIEITGTNEQNTQAAGNEAQTAQTQNEAGTREDMSRGGTRQTQTAAQADGVQTTDTAGTLNAQTFTNTLLQNVDEALNLQQTSYATRTPEAADVLRQVLDFMRMQVSPEMTEMEMQLHPQSLGRVNVMLTAMENGEMMARFATQNDAVRAALEGQMVQLQQRFEEQGLRVTEIQVTVEERAFDGNRERDFGREDQANDQETEVRRAGRMRRVSIDLSGMDATDVAALDDDTRLTAEVMAAEGQTVNYTA